MSKNKLFKIIIFTVILFGIWINLNGNVSILTIISGIIICPFAIYITWSLLEISIDNFDFDFSILKLIKYYIFLIIQIYKSGICMPAKIFNPNLKPTIVEVKTNLKDEKQIVLLANSITLTPGTITITTNKDILTVLWLPGKNDDINNPYKEVVSLFEKEILNI